MATKEFEIKKHILVAKHQKASEKEKKELLEKYNISVYDLPFITKNDAAIKELEIQEGDVIKITRKSPTAGEAVFYRCVVNV